jgi:hypothetical protein
MRALFELCYKNIHIMNQLDKSFLESLKNNWPNYDNDWLFQILLDLKESYALRNE